MLKVMDTGFVTGHAAPAAILAEALKSSDKNCRSGRKADEDSSDAIIREYGACLNADWLGMAFDQSRSVRSAC
jgi:hypothetical protein